MATKAAPATAAAKPEAAAAPARIVKPEGPVTGRKGEEVLTEAMTRVFIPSAMKDRGGDLAGLGAGETGEESVDLGNGGPEAGGDSQKPEVVLPTEAGELAELTQRAKANGVTPEEQHAAEVAELDRLTAKATAEGKTVEQVAAEEEGAGRDTRGSGEKTFTQTELEAAIQGRVHKLADENATLRKQLEEARSQKPETGNQAGGLEGITDAAALTKFKNSQEAALGKVNRLMALLPVNPARVERELREMLGQDAAEMEFTPETLADTLYNAKEQFEGQLKAVPQREAWLAENAKADELVPRVIPWIKDPADPRTALFTRFSAQIPGIKVAPAWKYWLGLAVEGHFARLESAQGTRGKEAESKPGKFIPKVRFPASGRAGGGTPAPAGSAVAQAKARLKAKGDEAALESYLKAAFGAQ